MKTFHVFGIVAVLMAAGCSDSPTEPQTPTPAPTATVTPTPTPVPTPAGQHSFAIQGGCDNGQPLWMVTNQGSSMLAGGQWAITAANGVVAETGGFQLMAGQQVVITARHHALSGGQWALVLIYLDYASSTPKECVTSATPTPTSTPTVPPAATATPTASTPTPTATPAQSATPTPCAPFQSCGGATPTPTVCPPGPGGGCQ